VSFPPFLHPHNVLHFFPSVGRRYGREIKTLCGPIQIHQIAVSIIYARQPTPTVSSLRSPLNFVLVVTVLAFTPLLLVKLAKKALKESNPELWALWEKQQLISAPRGLAVGEGAAPSSAPSLLTPSTPILRSDLAKHKSVEDRVNALEALVLELKGKRECVVEPTPSTPPLLPPPPPHAASVITPPSTTP
jgi:hypothetical protein